MGADNTWSGRVEITPPLTWQQLKTTIATEDVRIEQREEDGPLGRIITGVAVVPDRPSQWGPHTGQELQSLIDQYPGHEFTGSLRVDWKPVYGEDQVLAERWTVVERTVLQETAHLAWTTDGESEA